MAAEHGLDEGGNGGDRRDNKEGFRTPTVGKSNTPVFNTRRRGPSVGDLFSGKNALRGMLHRPQDVLLDLAQSHRPPRLRETDLQEGLSTLYSSSEAIFRGARAERQGMLANLSRRACP